MPVKQVFDLSIRATVKRFLSSLKASNRYSEGYLASLETTVAMSALYAEEQGWPDVPEIATEHIEDYLAYLQDRVRWFGERTYAEPWKLSKGHINAQYRRLNRSFNCLVEREHIDENPLADIEPPSLEEKTVRIVPQDQVRDLLTLADPVLARTPAHRFRLTRDRAVLYAFWDTPGRLSEIAKLTLENTDLTNGTLLVMGKGRKERKMRIGDTARSAIWDYLQEREVLMPRTKALWVSEQGEALLPNGKCQLLRRLARRTNIEGMYPHRFRHSYAINALRAGMPEQVLKIVGGRRKIPGTYFKTLGEEDAIEFHRQIRPGDRLGKATAGAATGEAVAARKAPVIVSEGCTRKGNLHWCSKPTAVLASSEQISTEVNYGSGVH